MVVLKEVDGANFGACISLKRESSRFVGGPEYVLAEAYIYREDSRAYALMTGDEPVGLVILRVSPRSGKPYSFTDLFIADDFQRRGYGVQAVEAILEKFSRERMAERVEIQVHSANEPALRLYRRTGFEQTGHAEWNRDFLILTRRI